jgi:hypothetical protein
LQAEGQRFASIREWCGKHAGRVARIVGRLHLLKQFAFEPWRTSPELRTVEAAWAIGWYEAEHALAAHDLMGTNEEVEAARALLDWIRRHCKPDKPRFSIAEAHTGLKSRAWFERVAGIRSAVGLLAEYQWVRESERPQAARKLRKGPGRPRSKPMR